MLSIESIINGTPFIKPDMSNIETWPIFMNQIKLTIL